MSLVAAAVEAHNVDVLVLLDRVGTFRVLRRAATSSASFGNLVASARLPWCAYSLQTNLVLDRDDIPRADRNGSIPVTRRSHVEHKVEEGSSRLGRRHISIGILFSRLPFLACVVLILG